MFHVCAHMLQFAVMTRISAAWLVYMLHLKSETMLVNLWLPQRTAGGRFNYVYSLLFFNGGVYKLSYGNLQNTEVLKRWQDQVLRIQKEWKGRIKVDHTTLTEPMHLKITYPIGKPLAPSPSSWSGCDPESSVLRPSSFLSGSCFVNSPVEKNTQNHAIKDYIILPLHKWRQLVFNRQLNPSLAFPKARKFGSDIL